MTAGLATWILDEVYEPEDIMYWAFMQDSRMQLQSNGKWFSFLFFPLLLLLKHSMKGRFEINLARSGFLHIKKRHGYASQVEDPDLGMSDRPSMSALTIC